MEKKVEGILAQKENNKQNDTFFIVGIGASAGGLEALENFFKNMPVDNGLAFVVIQHFDPNFKNLLAELLQKITTIPVVPITNQLEVQANHIYVIPSNRSVTIIKGFLFLAIPKEKRGLRLPIDVFLCSLALDQLDRSVGIILSGMGSDGSEGIKEIITHKGLILVQDPKNASSSAMPESAIAAVTPNGIATAEELPAKLLALLQSKLIQSDEIKTAEIDLKSLDKIIILLQGESGHDFTLYKKSTLIRRIERRIGIHNIDSMFNYAKFLKDNPKEVELLFKELLIGVTNFFRDTLVWEYFKKIVLPDLINELPDGFVMRAWILACSTGEEAYSLAIIFKEVMEQSFPNKKITLQIFATDLDSDAIDKARKGIFGSSIVENVSQERIQKFFRQEVTGYKVSKEIREMVVFAPHNVTKDPPFTRLNLLFCRNMLIYMEPKLQTQLMELFYYSLVPDGIMLLGSAETLGKVNKGFDIVDSKLKFFKRKLSLKRMDLNQFPTAFTTNIPMTLKNPTTTQNPENIQASADQLLLQQFAPASVLVTDNGDIIYITGKTGKYLEPVAGKANWNIYAMARDGIKDKLPDAFRKAILNYEPVLLENIKFSAGCVTITIQKIAAPEAIKGMLMVIFSDVKVANNDVTLQPLIKDSVGGQIETQLALCYQDLQNTREEMKTSQEELQSINEELQSTNEELTTSKEETQSLNEELQTINAELQSKLIDFEKGGNDAKNLLNSIDIAVLFVDNELNIRRITDAVTKIFNFRSSDIGRPFTDFTTDLLYPEIGNQAIQVIHDLIPIQNTVATTTGSWFYVRILPNHLIDGHIDGLVITFTDITNAKSVLPDLKIES